MTQSDLTVFAGSFQAIASLAFVLFPKMSTPIGSSKATLLLREVIKRCNKPK